MWTDRDRDIMQDVCRLVSQHTDPDQSDSYWESLFGDVTTLLTKWGRDPLAEHFAFAVIDYYEKMLLEMVKNGKNKKS